MTHQNKMRVSTQLTLSVAIFLAFFCGGQVAFAAPLPQDGGYVKVGVGFSPYARTGWDRNDVSKVTSGLAPSVAIGVVWARQHSLDVRWQNAYLRDFQNKTQGYLAVTYTHYLRKHGPAPFFDIGFGLQHGPPVTDDSIGRDFNTNAGLGFTVGAGLRFSRRFEVAADFAVGSSGRFFAVNNNYDFSYQQLAFSLRYAILGG